MQIEFYRLGGEVFNTRSMLDKFLAGTEDRRTYEVLSRPAREYSRDGARMIEVAGFEFVAAEYWRIPLDQEAEDIRQSPRNRELHRIVAKIASGEYC